MLPCPVCRQHSEPTPIGDSECQWWCEKCGFFSITGTVEWMLKFKQLNADERDKLSALIRRKPRERGLPFRFTEYDLEHLLAEAGLVESPGASDPVRREGD